MATKKATKKATIAKTPAVKKSSDSFLSKVGPNSRSLASKKYVLPVIGLLVLIGLGVLASKFLVLAWVDNKPVSKLAYYAELDKKYGKDQQDQMIVEVLIESEAQKRKLTVSEDEINKEIKKIEDEQGGAERLTQILQLQNISQDEFKKLVKLQILREKLFSDGAAITDTEVNSYYEQNRENLVGSAARPDASTEAKLKDSVRQQLMQQKIGATFSAWVQENLTSNRVVRVK